MLHRLTLASLTAAFAALSACAQDQVVAQGDVSPVYQGIQTVLLEDDMVSFRVALQGAQGRDEVETYGRCAAAQYALIRGFGFARHVRTTVAQDGNTWRGDAVYLISAALPPGLRTIDAEVTVRDCGALGIPTI
ncbi:MAG: hypothetical protein JXR75_07505 [Rhodobacteraceae bacterium]|nr:hypothetical protein [Paracoccaceae bacterium]